MSNLSSLLTRYIRAPVTLTYDPQTGAPVPTFEPPLDAAEQIIYDRIVRLDRSLIPGLTHDEWAALEPDIDGLRTYHALATPTAAQTAQATKAIIRILRALLKD